jgi:hypothetical protein
MRNPIARLVALTLAARLQGLTTTMDEATRLAPGRFPARLAVPRGGVRSIVIALRGWRYDTHGTTLADMRSPIENDPTR